FFQAEDGIRDFHVTGVQTCALPIWTSEVEHVLATQTLKQGRAKTMKIEVKGKAAPGITAKDIVLAIIGKTGSAGGTGHVVEFCEIGRASCRERVEWSVVADGRR